ncbi:acetylglutamate kinase [Stomatohabitans albus]|uniref:acetylglutamate kinase n=1 Tax=Stomatohabitans albus TaxID=3110766 RepID=UPI00300D0690
MDTTSSLTRREHAQFKANILAEALPWMTTWAGRTVVLKIGGNAIADANSQVAINMAEDVAMLHTLGIRLVVVHGGGPQISALADQFNYKPQFADGMRVTDDEMMTIVQTAMCGQVNPMIVRLVADRGVRAVGLAGTDANCLTAHPRPGFGRAGDITAVDPTVITTLLDANIVPVIAPISRGDDGGLVNVNADAAAGAIAAAIRADKVIVLTNIEGLYTDFGTPKASLVNTISTSELHTLIQSGTVEQGMIPKLNALHDAVVAGVPQGHMLDGQESHAVLLEIFTDDGIGTMVLPDDASKE